MPAGASTWCLKESRWQFLVAQSLAILPLKKKPFSPKTQLQWILDSGKENIPRRDTTEVPL